MMFKNRTESGKNNISGENIASLRKRLKERPSQRKFAETLQRFGLDVDKNAIQRMESGERFITDIELKIIAEVLEVTCDQLIG